MNKRNPYEVLGLPQDATPAQIRSRFKNLSLRLHPDRNPEHAQAMTDLTWAYAILKSPERRERFEKMGTTDPNHSYETLVKANVRMLLSKALQHEQSPADIWSAVRDSMARECEEIGAQLEKLRQMHARLQNQRNQLGPLGDDPFALGGVFEDTEKMIVQKKAQVQEMYDTVSMCYDEFVKLYPEPQRQEPEPVAFAGWWQQPSA